jgi:prevent-host-death family protein
MSERPRGSGSESVSSTEAQNNFGEVLARVSRGGRVFITRYQRPQAVVLSMAEYEALVGEDPVDLEALEREFDALVERMQTESHRAGVDALFGMSSEALGESAVDAARAAQAARAARAVRAAE